MAGKCDAGGISIVDFLFVLPETSCSPLDIFQGKHNRSLSAFTKSAALPRAIFVFIAGIVQGDANYVP
jgi:hypothetical protein